MAGRLVCGIADDAMNGDVSPFAAASSLVGTMKIAMTYFGFGCRYAA
jgi:hypothetical protein